MHDRFQILSLDGGGIKGLFSAAVLAYLEEDLGCNIVEHFDLITGTSTGGIIAIGLASGLRPREIVEFYVSDGPKIFPAAPFSSVKQLFRAKYNPHQLEKSLKRRFQDKLLAHCCKRVVIPSYNIDEDDIYLFKTPHHPRLRRDWKVPLWKVALATSAAPTYFPACKHIDNMRLIDGGVWANNPCMIGIVEALSVLGVPLAAIRLLSLGTTEPVKNRSAQLNSGGKAQWAIPATDIILRGQSIGAYTQALHLLGENKVLRLNPSVPDGLFELDRISERELLAKASHVSRPFGQQVKDLFCDHLASQFVPLHTQGNAQ